MAKKHGTWMRSRGEASPEVKHAQRKLLGQLLEHLRVNNLGQGKVRRVLPDGTAIIASFDGTTPIVTAIAPRPRVEEEETDRSYASCWLPAGFVFYPASDDSPQGWGVPSVDIIDDEHDQWHADNLAPGLAADRWTEGGQLGQVLVTRELDAGYPQFTAARRDMVAPALFHPTAGLYPIPPASSTSTPTWAAYRLEFTDMPAESPGATSGLAASSSAWKREHWQLVNDHRAGLGLDRVLKPIRGYYDSAQATVECVARTNVLGHFYEGYPSTYRTEDDRGSKDGITIANAFGPNAFYIDDRNVALSVAENLLAGPATGIEVIGVDPNGLDILRVPVGATFTPQEALDEWLTSPLHTANIENPKWNFGALADDGYPNQFTEAATLNVGVRQSYYAQHFGSRDNWIAVGNATWRSSDPTIPALSWWSFNSMSLAWETWPISFTQTYDEPNDEIDVDVYVSARFTTAVDEDEGTAYACWLQYVDNALGGVDRRSRPGIGPAVMANGRVIGYAPKAGLVWGAGMQALPLVEGQPRTVRLVILTHHATDCPESDELVRGMTAKLRVWYVDLPASHGVVGMPNAPIRGVYGEEDDSWPWIQLNSPYSWRGGALVDVTDGDTLLKYTSTWRFSPDGTKAVCLRDYGDMDTITRGFFEDSGCGVPTQGLNESPHFPSHSGRFGMDTSGQHGVMLGAVYVRYLELDLTDPESPGLTVSGENFGARPHALQEDYESHAFNLYYVNAWYRPAAADYLPDGTLRFAFHVTVFYDLAYQIVPDILDPDPSGVGYNTRQGVYFGDWGAWYGITGNAVRWYSTIMALPWLGEELMCPWASVLDVRDEVFATCGQACKAVDLGIDGSFDGEAAGYPFWLNPENQVYRVSTLTADCLACEQFPATYTLRVHRGADVVLSEDVPNASQDVHDRRLFPNWYEYYSHTQLLMHTALTATYATDGAGAWAASAIYVAQPGVTLRFVTPGHPPTDPPSTYWEDYLACFNNCGYGWQVGDSLLPTTTAHCVDRGGTMASSFADTADLADLMQTPGANPRTLYARHV